jgi:phage I-like protein
MPKQTPLSRHQPAKPERVRFSFVIAGDTPPTEFRIFTAGINESQKGSVLFDDLAAKLVMASYKRWGIDLAIDLEHGMVDVAPGAADPTARDARGWCKLEVRNGELWAVDVKWTPDGIKRLTNKTQRYISPCFDRDVKTKRVVEMFNIALTAIPATNQAPALVAANALRILKMPKTVKVALSMDKDLVLKALEALQAGDDEAATEILKGMIAGAASGEEPGADDGSEGDGAEGVAPPAEGSAVSPKVTDTSGDAADPGDPAEDPDEKDDADPAKKPERKAMRAMLRTLTGAKTFGTALTAVEAFRKSHLTLETERTKLAAERAVLESAERRACVVELVTLGAEFPSTVWADDKAKTIKPRWLKMPIEELRAHTVEQRAARKGQANVAAPGVRPPPGTVETVELSAVELQICKEMKCEPADYVRLKAKRDGGDGSYFQSIRDRDAAAQALIAKVGT